MIVYLFNDQDYVTVNLPVKISGMYPIYVNGKIIANIISERGKWFIQLSNGFKSKEAYLARTELTPFKIYQITSTSGQNQFTIIATPKYDPNLQEFDIPKTLPSLTIGSHPNCDICYNIESNGQEFLRIARVDSQWIAESNSPNFFVSGHRIVNGQKIFNGDCIFFYGFKMIIIGSRIVVNNPNNQVQIMNHVLAPSQSHHVTSSITVPDKPSDKSKDDLPLYSKDDYFYKVPRFNYIIEEAQVDIDEPPTQDKGDNMPAILTLGPQLTMAGASVFMLINLFSSISSGTASTVRIISSVGMVVVMLVGIVVWPIVIRAFKNHRLKRKEQKRQKKYSLYLQQKKHLLDFIKANQRQTLLNNNPAPEKCAEIIENKSQELWQRNISHEDFLTVRLGLGKVETKLKIEQPKEKFSIEDEDNLLLALKRVVKDALYLDAAPITYDFTVQSIDAVVGPEQITKEFMDCVFLQILTFHSYTDLKLVVFTKEPKKWNYLKIVPHCWDNQKKTRYFATSLEELSTLCHDLEKIFDARTSNSEEEKLEDDGDNHTSATDFKDYRPYYLFFIDDMTSVRNVALIKKILHYKRNLGFSIITTTESISTLPSETADFIGVSERLCAVMTAGSNSNQIIFTADFNTAGHIDMYLCAQMMSNIPVLVERGKFELPKSISFLELYNYGRVEQLNSLARWSDNNPSISLSVPIGIDQSGETFEMDIHEKAYGPHGLVAGTTGSGKSEWIITYILSLAVNFSPDEVQFVLIDYKGGGLAKSFENADLNIKLPHLAGTITNLDKSEIFRSISAIESELKRRQSIFNATREKLKTGSMDIYDYQQCYRKGLVDEPMSHLLIVCDEFAELKQQQPDFMDQLISTSRVGRSLGVHLILATQKPSGVVNDQIWSNSKFKVCLKVQDQGDSREVLRKPDAAFLKQTGSFYLQVGSDDYYNLGQSAWAGAKYYPSDVVQHKIDDSIQCIDNIGQVIDSFKEREEVRESQGEELLNIVSYISNTSRQVTLKSRPLWLPNIPPKILLADLYKKYNRTPGAKYTYKVVIGEYDEPRQQKQGLLEIDLAAGNVAIIGQTDSGIDNLISTIIWSSVCEHTPAEIAYYIIDFGAETLKKFAKFPQVGEVVFQDEIEKVAGVLDLVIDEINHRKEILSEYNGSFEYYNKVEKEKMNLVVMVINNFDILGENLPKLNDLLTTLFRDAPKYGVIFVVSANAPNAIGYRQMQFFNHAIAMQLSDDGQYRSITNCRRGLIPKRVPGRGICKVDANNIDSYCEFQTAMIDTEEREIETIKNYANKCVDYYKCKVKQLAKIPDDLSSDDLAKFVTTLSDVPIGFDLYDKTISKYDFLSQKLHLFTGKNIADNITFVYGLASILSKVPNVNVRIVDMLDLFKKPILDIRIFDEDVNVVFGALEKDVLTRTETQDYGINIVLGAGQYKNKLSKGGLEIFQNLFTHLSESKNNIFIFIDDYDKLRNLKLEKWFSQVTNTSTGLWLGADFSNQSLFTSDPVSSEDKKYNYNGLAYKIDHEEYNVIKTLMDEDN